MYAGRQEILGGVWTDQNFLFIFGGGRHQQQVLHLQPSVRPLAGLCYVMPDQGKKRAEEKFLPLSLLCAAARPLFIGMFYPLPLTPLFVLYLPPTRSPLLMFCPA